MSGIGSPRSRNGCSRRDNIQSSDFVSFYVDPYHDRLSGYNFRVTADGVKADHYLFDDTSRDPDWDAVWEAETWEDDRGWYLEVRIPFQAIRFKPAPEMTWGMQFYRWLHSRGEDTGWVTWERELSGFVSRWGTLTGLYDVQNPRALEVLPYTAAGLTDNADPQDDPLMRCVFQKIREPSLLGRHLNHLSLRGAFHFKVTQTFGKPLRCCATI